MRRGISVTMVIFGLGAALTGIWQFFPPFNRGIDPPHIIFAFPFGILIILHTWLNRKPVLRYFRRLGWWWVVVSLGFILVIWAGIVMPTLFQGG